MGIISASVAIVLAMNFSMFAMGAELDRNGELIGNFQIQTAELGAYRIIWEAQHPENSKFALSITALDPNSNTHREVLSTRPGTPFLHAEYGKTTISERSGSFVINREKPDAICQDQTVSKFEIIDRFRLRILGQLTGRRCAISYYVDLITNDSGKLDFRVGFNNADLPPNRTSLILAHKSGQRFFGLGEQFTFLNLAGQAFDVVVGEQGHGRGLQPWSSLGNRVARGIAGTTTTTYAPQPYYVTDSNQAILLGNEQISRFDFTNDSTHEIEVLANTIFGSILWANSPLEMVEKLTGLTGRPPGMPAWMDSGAIVAATGGTDKVVSLQQKLADAKAKVSAFFVQDWCGQRLTAYATRVWWNWQLDEELYPGWQNMVGQFRTKGIRILGYINPFLTPPRNNAKGRNLYAEALNGGYLVKDSKGKIDLIKQGGFSAALVDLTNARAVIWLKEIMIQHLLGIGMSGWMADFGEALSFESAPGSGEKPEVIHNRYPTLWAKLNREVLGNSTEDEGNAFFSRSAFTGTVSYPSAFWAGDQLTTWDRFDGIKTSVIALLSSGISGTMPFNHSDIGGYTTLTFPGHSPVKRDKELLLRWVELNAFTALMRTHEGNRPDLSFQIDSDQEALEHFAKFTRVFASIKFYRDQLSKDAVEKGYPIVRPLFFHYPKDEASWDIDQQFMLGDQLLIAPVLDKGVREIPVYLPPGSWIHLWTGAEYSGRGDKITVRAPIGEPPVFYPKGSNLGQKIAKAIVEAIKAPN